MNSQNTQQLTDDIQKETSQSLNNSESGGVSANDSISGDNHHDLHSNIDLNKTELNHPNGDKDFQDVAEGIPLNKIRLMGCAIDETGRMICKP